MSLTFDYAAKTEFKLHEKFLPFVGEGRIGLDIGYPQLLYTACMDNIFFRLFL